MVSGSSAIQLTGRVGKAYAISDIISLSYFYPQGELPIASRSTGAHVTEPAGLTGDVTTTSRPLKEGENMEWIMLSGVG